MNKIEIKLTLDLLIKIRWINIQKFEKFLKIRI